uniref:Crustin 1 n=1 Tax=Macrobrachium nipponense TaxID=159736 RepID=A0A5J6CZD0_MACNP|nr:crustin 1 [Macrobrachium nipponense]
MQGLLICSLAIVGVVVALPSGPGVAPPATCRYWCRTPAPANQVYCCEDISEPEGPVGVKIGSCPRVRPACPPVRSGGPPYPCSNDFKCFGADKCCYDVCLEEHVCKPQSFFNQGFLY